MTPRVVLAAKAVVNAVGNHPDAVVPYWLGKVLVGLEQELNVYEALPERMREEVVEVAPAVKVRRKARKK